MQKKTPVLLLATTIMNCLLGARICFPSLFSFFFFFFIVLSIGGGLRMPPHHHYISVSFHDKSASAGRQPHVHHKEKERAMGEEVGMEVYPTGSSLPDCSHACGPCFPCKRVMVSFKCSTAESCPIVYRCMCKGKYYHVPSN